MTITMISFPFTLALAFGLYYKFCSMIEKKYKPQSEFVLEEEDYEDPHNFVFLREEVRKWLKLSQL